MAAHHKYGASGAEGWMFCAGKVVMEAPFPNDHSPYSDEGSAAHFLASESLLTGKSLESFIGREIACCTRKDQSDYECFKEKAERKSDVRNVFTVDETMVENLQVYIDTVVEKAEGGLLYIETRVNFGAVTGMEDAFGTADAIALTRDNRLLVIDLKYGYRRVSASHNKQLSLYALGAIHYLKDIVTPPEIAEVELCIVQPRIGNIDSWLTTVVDLRKFGNKTKAYYRDCKEAEDMLVKLPVAEWEELYLHPSEKACEWCRAKASCKRFANSVIADVSQVIGAATIDDLVDLDVEDAFNEAVLKLPKMPFEQLMDMYMFVTKHKLFIEAVEETAKKRMLEGERDKRYKLVAGKQGNRAWSNEKVVAGRMLAEGIPEESVYTKTLLSPSKFEKLVGKKSKLLERFENLIERSEGKPTIADYMDKRPPIVDADDFERLPTEDGLVQELSKALGEDLILIENKHG